jgi:prepilin-type N-terminal cleavage/methylation domain-containing protein
MISTKNKKGFTLIELIVVITILAILGTIAFISLNGYTGQTRDAKRTTDLRSIQSKMELKIATAGTSLTSFVANSDNKNTGMSVQGVSVTSSTDYNAGSVSFTQLDVKESEFKDPQNSSYVIGVYTKNGGAYELAASMEGDDETGKSAYVVGTYSPRKNDSTGEIAVSRVGSTKEYTITNATEQGFFRKGDTLAGDATVDKVSADGKTITLTGTPTLNS